MGNRDRAARVGCISLRRKLPAQDNKHVNDNCPDQGSRRTSRRRRSGEGMASILTHLREEAEQRSADLEGVHEADADPRIPTKVVATQRTDRGTGN